MYCTPLAGSSFLDESFIKVEKVDSTNAKIWEHSPKLFHHIGKKLEKNNFPKICLCILGF
jgi:hypothetical protein